MIFTAIENQPISINLLTQINDTGWSISDGIAYHSCNNGSIILTAYPVTAGHTYKASYALLTVSGGYNQLQSPGSNGVQQTSPGFYVETISPTANGFASFFSNATCSVIAFYIQDTFQSTSNTQQNTIVYSFDNRKWGEFRTIAPDFGFSIYIDMLTVYQGSLYLHENGSNSRNNFYGTQYQSMFQFVENKQAEELKTYNSIVLQSNQLMVTTAAGITTSLGQVSELIEQDFLKSVLNDGVSTIDVYSVVGTYSASFMRNINSPGGIVNGDQLAGNYVTISLITINGNTPLQLFSIAVNASQKHIGTR